MKNNKNKARQGSLRLSVFFLLFLRWFFSFAPKSVKKKREEIIERKQTRQTACGEPYSSIPYERVKDTKKISARKGWKNEKGHVTSRHEITKDKRIS